MDFPTKQSYVEWRDVKRVEYALIARTLRDLRIDLSRTQSESAKKISEERTLATAEARPARWRRLRVNVATTQHTKFFLRGKARELMAARTAAKEVARGSWERWRASNQP